MNECCMCIVTVIERIVSFVRVNLYLNAFCVNVCLIFFYIAESVAVMSVDLGSEWMKLAIVKPGVPMEIILNKYVCKI